MDLARDVMDKQLLDSEARRCGKVDDLLLVSDDQEPPVVAAILAQQGALAKELGPVAVRIVQRIYRLLGVAEPKPVEIDWQLVEKIDVVVHLSKTRNELGLDTLQLKVAERIVSKIPGA